MPRATRYHREDIKAALRKRFGSLLDFERVRGLPANSTKDVLRGRGVAQTEQAISDVMDVPLHVLFPLRHTAPEGEPSTKVDDNTAGQDAHPQIREMV